MEEAGESLHAVCGLDCAGCDLFRVPADPVAAERVAAWFKKGGWIAEGEGVADVVRKSPYCQGCRGDRSVHWSPNCSILKCCVDEKGLRFCYECAAFRCEKLDRWASGYPHHARALERLKRMKKEEGSSERSQP